MAVPGNTYGATEVPFYTCAAIYCRIAVPLAKRIVWETAGQGSVGLRGLRPELKNSKHVFEASVTTHLTPSVAPLKFGHFQGGELYQEEQPFFKNSLCFPMVLM